MWGYQKKSTNFLNNFLYFLSKLFLINHIINVLMTMVKSSNPRTQTEVIENGDAHSSIQFHVFTSTVTHSLQNTIRYALSPKHYPFPLTLTNSDPSLPIAKCQFTEPSRLTWHLFLINPKDFSIPISLSLSLSLSVVSLWIQNHERMWFYLELACDFRFDLNQSVCFRFDQKLIIVIF